MPEQDQQSEVQQALRVVSGNPTPNELAAVIAVISHRHAEELTDSEPQGTPAKSRWSKNSGTLRAPLTPGHLQWQAAYRSGL